MECNDFTDKKLSNIDFVGRRDLLIFTPWLGQLISKEGRKRRGYMQGKKTLINVVGVPRHDSREGMGKVFVYQAIQIAWVKLLTFKQLTCVKVK